MSVDFIIEQVYFHLDKQSVSGEVERPTNIWGIEYHSTEYEKKSIWIIKTNESKKQ